MDGRTGQVADQDAVGPRLIRLEIVQNQIAAGCSGNIRAIETPLIDRVWSGASHSGIENQAAAKSSGDIGITGH